MEQKYIKLWGHKLSIDGAKRLHKRYVERGWNVMANTILAKIQLATREK